MKGKAISLSVKIYSVLFGSVCYIVFFILNKRLPNLDESLGILTIMLGFNSVVLSVDVSMVTKNIKQISDIKEGLENIQK